MAGCTAYYASILPPPPCPSKIPLPQLSSFRGRTVSCKPPTAERTLLAYHCANCLRKIQNLQVKCEICQVQTYCSTECKSRHSPYHNQYCSASIAGIGKTSDILDRLLAEPSIILRIGLLLNMLPNIEYVPLLSVLQPNSFGASSTNTKTIQISYSLRSLQCKSSEPCFRVYFGDTIQLSITCLPTPQMEWASKEISLLRTYDLLRSHTLYGVTNTPQTWLV